MKCNAYGGVVFVKTQQAMKPIRVLVANQPRLMRELMVATISEQPDIEIVGEVQDDGELAEPLRKRVRIF